MEQLEVTIPAPNPGPHVPDYRTSPVWTVESFDGSRHGYPVSGDDIARWRAEKG